MTRKKLGEICYVMNGFAFQSINYVPYGVRIIRIANVQKGYIDDSAPVFYPIDTAGIEKFLLSEGDLLLSLTGNVGRVAILQKELLPAALNQRVACLRVKNNGISLKYLFYFLSSSKFENDCILASNGVAQKNLSTEWLKDYEIPICEPREQAAIVTLFDKILVCVEKRKQQLEKLDLLVKAKFYEIFGNLKINSKSWEKIVPLSEIANYYIGLTYKPENVTENGVIVLRSSNIKNGELDLKDIVRVNCPIREKLHVREGDILMCSRNGSAKLVGKVAEIRKLQEPATFGAFMMIIRSKYNKFLLTYFESPVFREQIKAGTTTTINQITSSMLDKIYLPLPPQPLIEMFAHFVERTEKIKSKIKQSLEKLELLKQSFLQKYFG